MLRLREMLLADIPFAIRLTGREGWGIPRRDFIRILKLDKHGSFVAVEGRRRVGLTTTMRYGRTIAWIGNVVVEREYRGRRIGQRLVEHAVSYLSRCRVRHIALYSFKENLQFYRDLGFVYGARFARLRREPKPGTTGLTVEAPFNSPTMSSILEMDRKAFGADRRALITILMREGSAWYFGYKRDSRRSYILVKKYYDLDEIGPWISFGLGSTELDALLRLAISRSNRKPIEISCPVANRQAQQILKKHHFRVTNEGRVLFYRRLGTLGDPRALVAHGFLDKG